MGEESIYSSIIKNFKQANVSLENYLKNPQISHDFEGFLNMLKTDLDSFIEFFEQNKTCKIEKNLNDNILQLCSILCSEKFSANDENIDLLSNLQSSINLSLTQIVQKDNFDRQPDSSPRIQINEKNKFQSPDTLTKKFVLRGQRFNSRL